MESKVNGTRVNLRLTQLLLEASRVFMPTYGINSIRFTRVDRQGNCITACTTVGIVDYFFTSGTQVGPTIEVKANQSLWFLLPKEGSCFKLLNDFREKFNIRGILDHVENSTQFVDVFSFYSSTENSIATQFLNHKDSAEKFICRFKDLLGKSAPTSDQDKVILPREMLPLDSSNWAVRSLDSSPERIREFLLNTLNNLEDSFSKREKDCIRLILIGLSSKEIAAALNLSPRTVEHYIDNIKNKTGSQTKGDLTKFLLGIDPKSFSNVGS